MDDWQRAESRRELMKIKPLSDAVILHVKRRNTCTTMSSGAFNDGAEGSDWRASWKARSLSLSRSCHLPRPACGPILQTCLAE